MILSSPIGSQIQAPSDLSITLIVSRQTDMFLGVQIALHEKFGLTTEDLRLRFFAFLRSTGRINEDNPLARWANILRSDSNIVKSLNGCGNQPQCRVPFSVFEWFITALREFGVDFIILPNGEVQVNGVNPRPEISQWTITDKFIEVVKRAASLLPADVGEQLLALIDPLVISIAVAVVVVWAGSHFFGIGEIADVVLLIVGFISIGPIAWKAGEHLINFAMITVRAKTSEELDTAAKHLSEAVSLLGVQVVLALLLKKSPKVLRENPKYPFKPIKASDLPTVKRPPGEWFYRPKISDSPFLGPNTLGTTGIYGDIKYLSSLAGKAKDATILHEKVHRWLTPKFYPLRNYRITINWNSYAQSYLLRYLEEAIAQTVGLVGTYGFRQGFAGVSFPVKNGYVTIAEMGVEAAGILLGPINTTGMSYRVYFTYSKPSE